ncbi:MAG: tRNA (adenosine(37)-N6)-threonylcarbamoyltransferase complex ATPase subunit type 1 TsaE [Betaproteobacteria bacterium]
MTHSPILETATLHWPDEAACARAAAGLAAAAPRNAVITLDGGLGAGKTTFVRHLLQALGVQGRIKSPTYAVMEAYDVGWPVSHFDFYRFQDPQEWEDAGFRDVFAMPGLKLCEWPDKALGLMPPPDLALHLHTGEDGRREVRADAFSVCGVGLVHAMRSA